MKTDQTGRMPRLICLHWAHMPFCRFCHALAHGYIFRGSNLAKSICCLPSEKGSTLKDYFSTSGRKLFHLSLQERTPRAGKQTGSHKCCLPCKMCRISMRCMYSLNYDILTQSSRHFFFQLKCTDIFLISPQKNVCCGTH